MLAAGVNSLGGMVEPLVLPAARALRADEVLLDVSAAGVGNWDEFVRTGGWDVGTRPPMALGVEAAGTVAAVGASVTGFNVGDPVTTHSVPLREQGCWAEQFIAAAGHVALLPPGASLDAAAAFPVPALTADQVVSDALNVRAGQTVVVHGASGITGGVLVQLAASRGARVIATASPASWDRVRALGASSVLDYHQPDWTEQVRSLTGGRGADGAANAARDGSRQAIRAVRAEGVLATITSDPPPAERGIAVHEILVAPDGARLRRLVTLLAQGVVKVTVSERFPLQQAAGVLERVRHGTGGAALVLAFTGRS